MISKLPVSYASPGNARSMEFCRAFSRGCGGRWVTDLNMLRHGPVAGFWLPELYPILEAAQKDGRDWYYGDKAYFDRTKFYRVTKNSKMLTAFSDATPERFDQLGIKIRRWRSGSQILLCPQSDVFMRLNGSTQSAWIKDVTNKIRQYTDRPIVIHYKQIGQSTERIFERQLSNVWAVIVHSSMAGMQAVIHGVPCFATDPTSTSAVFGSTDLSRIENPVKPENREQMAWELADNQWTLSEIESGMAWEKIQ
jgi:hypothetical protein